MKRATRAKRAKRGRLTTKLIAIGKRVHSHRWGNKRTAK